MTKINELRNFSEKKKKIELLGCLVRCCDSVNYNCSESLSSKKWDELTLIERGYGNMDVIHGTEDGGHVYILFGHWNDGVL